MTDANNGPGRSLWSRLRSLVMPDPGHELRESLEGAIKIHAAQKPGEGFAKETKSMMLNIIAFSGLRVDDVMVPRADIVAIEDSASLRLLLDRFIEAGHSRMPVYRETLDEITGMVHVKDLLAWLSAKGGRRRKSKSEKAAIAGLSVPGGELAATVKQSGLHREVLFVPPSMPASDLLVRMQASHIHLAIVIDEYGGTDGLVSIEDLVEEIVGDISDEHDTDEDEPIRAAGEGSFAVLGRVKISQVEELLQVDLLPDEDDAETDTLAGLVFKMAGRVPARGEVIRHDSGIEFEIVESDPRRVTRIRIHRPQKQAAPAPGEDEKQ